MKFVVCTPRNLHGGVIALHELCRKLDSSGHEAKIFYADYLKCYNPLKFWIIWLGFTVLDTLQAVLVKCNIRLKILKNRDVYKSRSLSGCKRKYTPFVSKDTIVVYPDIAYGNFLNAKKVVRYLLYFNYFDESAYGKDDLFISYSKQYIDEKFNPMHRVASTPFFDFELYKQWNYGHREGKCYLIWNGYRRGDLPNTFDGPVIDKLSEKEKVELFNKCEYMYSYDEMSAYNSIACLCGCIPIIVPEKSRSLDSYRKPGLEHYGVAIGDSKDEIEYARSTRDKLAEVYSTVNARAAEGADRFVRYCKEYFNS